MAFLIVTIWMVTWTPYAVIAALQELGYGDVVHAKVAVFALITAKVSAIINTFVYGLR